MYFYSTKSVSFIPQPEDLCPGWYSEGSDWLLWDSGVKSCINRCSSQSHLLASPCFQLAACLASSPKVSPSCRSHSSPGTAIPRAYLAAPSPRLTCPSLLQEQASSSLCAGKFLGKLLSAAWSPSSGVWELLTAQHRHCPPQKLPSTSTSSNSAHRAGHCPPAVALPPTLRFIALQGSAEQFPGVLTVRLAHQVI